MKWGRINGKGIKIYLEVAEKMKLVIEKANKVLTERETKNLIVYAQNEDDSIYTSYSSDNKNEENISFIIDSFLHFSQEIKMHFESCNPLKHKKLIDSLDQSNKILNDFVENLD